MEPRIKSAMNRVHWMSRKGMNMFGWRPKMNLNIYKTYIRPMLEYGFQLQLLPKGVLKKLQKVENVALQKMLLAGKTTSSAAMHGVFGLESLGLGVFYGRGQRRRF